MCHFLIVTSNFQKLLILFYFYINLITVKKLIIILIFLVLVIFIYEVPLKNYIKKEKSDQLIETLKIMEKAGEAVEKYIIEWGKIPEVSDYKNLYKKLKELYDIELPLRDSWGNSLIFKRDRKTYEIISVGKDKKLGTIDDIVYKDGNFLLPTKNRLLSKIISEYMERGD